MNSYYIYFFTLLQHSILKFIHVSKKGFISLRKRERGGEVEGEGERKSQADSLLSAEPPCFAQSHNPKIMTGVEIKNQTFH